MCAPAWVCVYASISAAFFSRAHKRDDPENLCLPRDWKLCAIILWLHTRARAGANTFRT